MMTLYYFVTVFWFFFDRQTSLTDLLHSWKAYAVDGKNSSYANKMAARKVPVVQCAMQAAAKLRGTTAVNKERLLVLSNLWPGRLTDKPLSPESLPKNSLLSQHLFS